MGLIGMAILWGAAWPWGRIIAQGMPPLVAAALRFALASLVMLPLMYRHGGFVEIRRWNAKRWAGMVAAAATGIFAYSAFFMLSLQYVPASKGALVVTLNPVFTLLLSAWLFREHLGRMIVLGMALAAVGAVLVITHGAPWTILAGGLGVGEMLLLGCVAGWVAYTLIGRRLLDSVDAVTATGVTGLIGFFMLLAASLAVEGLDGFAAAVHAPWQAWAALLMLAFGGTALAYIWYFDGIKALGAGAAASYIVLVPVFGVALSAWWLGERIDSSLLFGGLMAVAGMALMSRGRGAGAKLEAAVIRSEAGA